jgi:hypothetical protein
MEPRNVLLAALLLPAVFACGGPALAPPPARLAPYLLSGGARVGEVTVAPDPDLSVIDRALLERAGVPGDLRQGVLDWLDQQGHFARDGELAVEVSLREVHVRSSFSALLLRHVAAADRLGARVQVTRRGEPAKLFPAEVASAVGGWAWRKPDARLERMVRVLSQRIAEGL